MFITIIYTVSIVDTITFALVLSTQNLYVNSLNGSQLYLGVLGSVSAGIGLILNPIVGSLSDSLGRKRIVIQSLLFNLAGNVVNIFISDLNVYFISRMISMFGSQLVPVIKSLIDDNIKDDEKKMSIIHKTQALGGICFIVGVLLSGHLSEYDNGFKIIHAGISFLLIISLVSVSFIKDETIKKEKPQDALSALKQIPENLKGINWPNYWDVFIIKLLSDITMSSGHFLMMPTLMNKYSLSGRYVSYIFALAGMMGMATSLSMGPLKRKFYKNDKTGLQALSHACLLMAFSTFGRGITSNFYCFCLCMFPTFALRMIFENIFTEIILQRAAPQEKGSVMGAFETTFSFSGLVVPLVCGALSEALGADAVTALMALPVLVGAALAYNRKDKFKSS